MKKSLYQYVNDVYASLPKGEIPLNRKVLEIVLSIPFEQMVNDDDACLRLIRGTLEFESSVATQNRERASHILVTWLLGIGLRQFFHLEFSENSFEKHFEQNLWLQTAMLHDFGYLRKEVSQENLKLEEISGNYDLLTDSYSEEFSILNDMSNNSVFGRFFTYSYSEIRNYYSYSQYLHRNRKSAAGGEKNDHGIVGACIAFKKYCEANRRIKAKQKNIEKEIELLPSVAMSQVQKIACIVAASHNLFKSDSPENDAVYLEHGLNDLLSTSEIRVTKENKLLLLMSLVDTLECTKRFSKAINATAYLQQATTLKYVDIEFDESLQIDFSRLYQYIVNVRKNNEMAEVLLRHVSAIQNMSSWTSFKTEYDEAFPFVIRIRL